MGPGRWLLGLGRAFGTGSSASGGSRFGLRLGIDFSPSFWLAVINAVVLASMASLSSPFSVSCSSLIAASMASFSAASSLSPCSPRLFYAVYSRLTLVAGLNQFQLSCLRPR